MGGRTYVSQIEPDESDRLHPYFPYLGNHVPVTHAVRSQEVDHAVPPDVQCGISRSCDPQPTHVCEPHKGSPTEDNWKAHTNSLTTPQLSGVPSASSRPSKPSIPKSACFLILALIRSQ